MTKAINTWAKLKYLCEIIHRLLYVECEDDEAQGYLPQLKLLLKKLPEDDTSIVGAEGQAIFHELCGNFSQAIEARQREVSLMKKLYVDIKKNKYDKLTKNALLDGRDEKALETRKAIIAVLQKKLSGN